MKLLNFTKVLLVPLLLLSSSCRDDAPSKQKAAATDSHFVSKETALKIAKNYNFSFFYKNKKNKINKEVRSILPIPYDDGNGVFCYIINYKVGGFLILAGDDRLYPVMACSPDNPFPTNKGGYPFGLSGWFHVKREHAKEIIRRNLKRKQAVQKAWEELLSNNFMGFITKGPLLYTKWAQGCGFNDYLPYMPCTGRCGKAYAGCGTVALAQLMRYWKSPINYNWNAMPNYGGAPETDRLIRDIYRKTPGIRSDCDGTTVSSGALIAVLRDFGYSVLGPISYSYPVIETEINASRPVILIGYGKEEGWLFPTYSNGHIWICDGYGVKGGDRALLMNWGFSGNWDGLYNYGDFSPDHSAFNFNVKILRAIRPLKKKGS